MLPAKHLTAWLQTNLYLSLADAPFDREDPTLNPTAEACTTCPRRSGYSTALFIDVQGDQCLESLCYHAKVNAHIDREIAALSELVQIEDSQRSPKEQGAGAVQRGHFREIESLVDNPDVELAPPCAAAKTAIIVYGERQDQREQDFQQQQQEYEAEQARREEVPKARAATFEHILENAPLPSATHNCA